MTNTIETTRKQLEATNTHVTFVKTEGANTIWMVGEEATVITVEGKTAAQEAVEAFHKLPINFGTKKAKTFLVALEMGLVSNPWSIMDYTTKNLEIMISDAK